MAIYTGVADANGDFNIPFGSNSYTSGEKITVTAEKDSAEKTIELYAPSEPTSGGAIQFDGTLVSFPLNIGNVSISIPSSIANHTFSASGGNVLWNEAKGLTITGATTIGRNAFEDWRKALYLVMSDTITKLDYYTFQNWVQATSLTISNALTQIPDSCFSGWNQLQAIVVPDSVSSIGAGGFVVTANCKSIILGSGLQSLSAQAFMGLGGCDLITCRALTPPLITNSSFSGLSDNCIFKVPAGSVSAYKAAPNWSAFAARIQAI